MSCQWHCDHWKRSTVTPNDQKIMNLAWLFLSMALRPLKTPQNCAQWSKNNESGSIVLVDGTAIIENAPWWYPIISQMLREYIPMTHFQRKYRSSAKCHRNTFHWHYLNDKTNHRPVCHRNTFHWPSHSGQKKSCHGIFFMSGQKKVATEFFLWVAKKSCHGISQRTRLVHYGTNYWIDTVKYHIIGHISSKTYVPLTFSQ